MKSSRNISKTKLEKKVELKRQMTLPGTDTELSRACDEYENARANLEKAQNSLSLSIEELIPIMKKHGKTSIRLDHGGEVVLRSGRITHDCIIFKKKK